MDGVENVDREKCDMHKAQAIFQHLLKEHVIEQKKWIN